MIKNALFVGLIGLMCQGTIVKTDIFSDIRWSQEYQNKNDIREAAEEAIKDVLSPEEIKLLSEKEKAKIKDEKSDSFWGGVFCGALGLVFVVGALVKFELVKDDVRNWIRSNIHRGIQSATENMTHTTINLMQ